MSEHLILHRTWDFQIHFDGEAEPRRWELERPNRNTQRAYAKHLVKLVYTGIDATSDQWSETTRLKRIKEFDKGFATGEYGWKSDFFVDSLKDDENRQALLHLWIMQAEAKANTTEAKQTTREQIEAGWDIVTGEEHRTDEGTGKKYSFKRTVAFDAWNLIVSMLDDPNPSRPPLVPGASL